MLREKGLKVTKQRLLILEALDGCSDRHLTAEEIYEIVKNGYPRIGLATVYRTIQLLLNLGLIESVQLEDGYVRYEIGKSGEKSHRHHHLICLGCKKVISFQNDLLDDLENQIYESTSFQVVNHEVKLYGYCRECLADRNMDESELHNQNGGAT